MSFRGGKIMKEENLKIKLEIDVTDVNKKLEQIKKQFQEILELQSKL